MTFLKELLTAQRVVLLPALGLAVVLLAACGRVDDQLVAQTPTRATATDGSYIHWSERLVDDEGLSGLPLRGADGFEVADFDKDGFADVAIMYEDSFHLRLAFGSGNPDQWQLVTLSAGAEVQEIEDGAVADLNRDGWPDLLVATEGGSLLYLQNPGEKPRTSPWQRVIPAGVQGRGSWIRVYLADLNGDGAEEAIAVNKGVTMPSGKGSIDVAPTPISWFSIGSNPLDSGSWVEHELARSIVPVNARPVDLDGDGDLDIVAGSRGEARMFWFENQTVSAGADPVFVQRPIDVKGRHIPAFLNRLPKALSGMNMAFTDMDADGRLDIVTHETAFSLVWLQQPGDVDGKWKIHSIGVTYPDVVTGIAVADINGDGRQDVITGGYSADPRQFDDPAADRNSRTGRIVWYEQGRGPSPSWTEHNISRRVRGMYDAFYVSDIDKDGLDDVLATRGNSGEFDGLFWLKQERSNDAQASFAPAREADSRSLALADSLLSRFAHWLLQ